MLCDSVPVGFRSIAFVARKPVVGVGLVQGDHTVVAVDFRQHRGSRNRDTVPVRFRSGHHFQWVWEMAGDEIVGAIQE